jgi:hypothetical protein
VDQILHGVTFEQVAVDNLDCVRNSVYEVVVARLTLAFPHGSHYLISMVQQQLGKIRTVLAIHSGNKCLAHIY